MMGLRRLKYLLDFLNGIWSLLKVIVNRKIDSFSIAWENSLLFMLILDVMELIAPKSTFIGEFRLQPHILFSIFKLFELLDKEKIKYWIGVDFS